MIYSLLTREYRRLDEGLPIYAYRPADNSADRGDRLRKEHTMGSVLADSGMFGHQRGKLCCFKDTSVIFCSSCSSSQEFGCKVIFMIDHCLLQHYMSNKQLPHISCIIVDEAHERSLKHRSPSGDD